MRTNGRERAHREKNVVTACKLNDVNQIINHGSETVEKGEVKSVIAELIYLPSFVSLGPPGLHFLLAGR